ncbi:hypothetical protein [Bacteroides uniformis]|nr:hypothetical protein [Bacteroides uniformis]
METDIETKYCQSCGMPLDIEQEKPEPEKSQRQARQPERKGKGIRM